MCPLSVHNGGEHEVGAEVPQFSAGRNGAECCARQGEVRVIDQQRTADHRGKHDRPVREGLAGEMRQDDLGCHAPEDKGHGQTVEDEVVIFQDERVRRTEPSRSSYTKDYERGPFQEDWQNGEALGAPCACNVDNTCGEVGDEKGDQDHGNPYVSEAHLAQLLSEAREVCDERSRPDLRPEEAGHADEGARNDKSLCGESAEVFSHAKFPYLLGR